MTRTRKLIVGCGYLGQRVAAAWHAEGSQVWVTTRSSQRAAELQALGYQSLVLDVSQPDTLENLPAVETLLFAVGYDRAAGIAQSTVYVEGFRNVLTRLPSLADRAIYVSSTGVYSQGHDEWVDEQSPCAPQREGGRCCLAAEAVLRESRWGPQAVILRLAGIYGPGRIPFVRQLRAGEPLPVEESGYLNLIHVDDAVQVVLAAEQARLPNLFVVSDGHPVRRGEYYRQVARQLNVTPRFAPPPADSAQASRASSSKRIRNARVCAELGIRWQYPDYKHGLAAILANQECAES